MLDLRRVERIHARLLVRYGTRWVGLYAGIDPDLVRLDWAHCLDGMSDAGIKYALENLPDDFPPTAAQFRRIGQSRPGLDDIQRVTDDRRSPPPPEVAAKLRELTSQLRGRR